MLVKLAFGPQCAYNKIRKMNILCLMHTYSVCSAYAVFFSRAFTMHAVVVRQCDPRAVHLQ